MRLFNFIALIAGALVFAWILVHADLEAVLGVMGRIGFFGAAAILATFGIAMISSVCAWSLTFQNRAFSAGRTLRLWLIVMVGEAFNMLTPLGAFGGEPFKALLLKRHHDISYAEGTASLVLVQVVNNFAQLPFAIIGAILMTRAGVFPDAVEVGIVGAIAFIGVVMLAIYAAMHGRLLAKLPARMGNDESAAKLAQTIAFLTDIEKRLFDFVRDAPGRSAAAVAFAFGSWVIGALEVYLVFWFLGAPITAAEAWIVETVIVLVRSATFFVPAHIGVQDGALAMTGRALTGSSEIGLAIALIRRGRELFWAGVGLLIYAGFNLRDRDPV